jgi:hypothetical protein
MSTALHEVGGNLSRGPLPPPDPAILPVLDGACGHNPGDTGPPVDPARCRRPAPGCPTSLSANSAADGYGGPTTSAGPWSWWSATCRTSCKVSAHPPPGRPSPAGRHRPCLEAGRIQRRPGTYSRDRTGGRNRSRSRRLCRRPTPGPCGSSTTWPGPTPRRPESSPSSTPKETSSATSHRRHQRGPGCRSRRAETVTPCYTGLPVDT